MIEPTKPRVKFFCAEMVRLACELINAKCDVWRWIVGSPADYDVEVGIGVHGIKEGLVAHLRNDTEGLVDLVFCCRWDAVAAAG